MWCMGSGPGLSQKTEFVNARIAGLRMYGKDCTMQDDERLDLRSVCRFFGGSKPLDPSTVYRNIKTGVIPKPIRIGGSSRWLRSECDAALKAVIYHRA